MHINVCKICVCHSGTVTRKDYPGSINYHMLVSVGIIFDGVKSRTCQPHLVPSHFENPNTDMILRKTLSKLCMHDTFSRTAVTALVAV